MTFGRPYVKQPIITLVQSRQMADQIPKQEEPIIEHEVSYGMSRERRLGTMPRSCLIMNTNFSSSVVLFEVRAP